MNRLTHRTDDVKRSLAELRDRLRAAHSAMDGGSIRQLSAEQRALVDALTRAALEGAGLTNPSAALREDITGTFQAAVADPDVTARLGRLTKAERWSGFGDLGDTAAVFTASRQSGPNVPLRPERPQTARGRRHGDDLAQARAALAAAEQVRADADAELSKRQTDLAVARLRRDEMRHRLQKAEHDLRAADEAYEDAKRASRDASELTKQAKARLKPNR